ncbi:MAG: hypothetical protein ABIN79_15795 [Marmoricola sp.]
MKVRRSGLVLDGLVILGWFLVTGVLGGLLWWQLADLPEVTRFQGRAVLQPTELTKEVSIDGWFFVIAVVGGVLGGVVLSAWRRRDPVVTVLLVTAGAVLAAYAMLATGQVVGPDEQTAVLRAAADGATAPMQLAPHAPGVVWVWPAAAALGSLILLWLTPQRDASEDRPASQVDEASQSPA